MGKLGIGSFASRTRGAFAAFAAFAAVAPAGAMAATMCSCALVWGIQEPIPNGDDATSEAPGTVEAGGNDTSANDEATGNDAPGSTMDGSNTDAPADDGPARDAPMGDADAGVPGYTISTPTPVPAFVDACMLPGSGPVLVNHDNSAISGLNMPFPFPFFGVTQTKYWINTNGVLGFDGVSSTLPRVVCPLPNTSPDPYPAIYAFGDDLYTRMTTGVCFAVAGSKPPRQLVVTWEDVMFARTMSGHLTFSVVLTETTNTVDLLYGTMTGGSEAQGDQATIGMEDTSGTLSSQFSCDMPVITSTPFAVRFTPKP